jgi:hypothetical protein
MNTNGYDNLVKDMNSAAKRIANFPEGLDRLTKPQLKDLYNKLSAYAPRMASGLKNKTAAMSAIDAVVEGNGRPQLIDDFKGKGRKVAENSCVLELHVRQPGFTKKIDSSTFLDKSGNKGKVDADVLHVSQDLIDKKKIKDLEKHRNELLDYVKAWSVKGGLLTPGNGQFLVPVKAMDAIYEKITKFGAERDALLTEFGKQWNKIKEDAKVKRGAFYSDNDYPPFAEIRSRYTHDWKFISNNMAEELENIRKEYREQERVKIETECAATAIEIQEALREGFHSMIEHFTDRLGIDGETGKPKRFNERRIQDIKDFLETFSDRNLTGDKDLEKLTEKAKNLIEGVDAKQLRKNEDLRGSLKQAFTELTEKAGSLIEVRTRAIRVD